MRVDARVMCFFFFFLLIRMEMNIHKRGVHNIYLRVYARIYYDNIPMRLSRIIKKDIIYTSK